MLGKKGPLHMAFFVGEVGKFQAGFARAYGETVKTRDWRPENGRFARRFRTWKNPQLQEFYVVNI